MLSAQTNSLGRRYAAAPITDWFNPSTAHQRPAHVRGHFLGGTAAGRALRVLPESAGLDVCSPPLGPLAA